MLRSSRLACIQIYPCTSFVAKALSFALDRKSLRRNRRTRSSSCTSRTLGPWWIVREQALQWVGLVFLVLPDGSVCAIRSDLLRTHLTQMMALYRNIDLIDAVKLQCVRVRYARFLCTYVTYLRVVVMHQLSDGGLRGRLQVVTHTRTRYCTLRSCRTRARAPMAMPSLPMA